MRFCKLFGHHYRFMKSNKWGVFWSWLYECPRCGSAYRKMINKTERPE